MKKITGLLLAVCMLISLFMTSPVYAATSGACGDNLTWSFDTAAELLIISGTGEMYDFTTTVTPWFEFKDKIKKIVFEEGISTISKSAFEEFDALTTLTLPESLITIASNAFYDCDALIEVILPSKVTTIGDNAFFGCDALTTVSIPGNRFIIGAYAFSECINLKNLTLNEGLYGIGNGVFYKCTNLENVTLPESLKRIGSVAFSYSGLKKVVIPDSVTNLSNAFTYCSNLEEIHFGKSLNSISYKVTLNSSALTTITVNDENEYYCAVDGVLFNKDMTTLISFPAGKAGAYTVPASVTTLEDYSFINATKIRELTLYSTLTTIGLHTFNSSKIFVIDYYGSEEQWLQIKGNSAAYSIPKRYMEVENTPADKCGDNLTWTLSDDGVLTISGTGAMYDFVETEFKSTPPWASNEPELYGIPDIKKIVIEEGVTYIGNYAFTGVFTDEYGSNETKTNCASVTEVSIADSVTGIGNYAFKNCEKLTKVRLPESGFTLGNNAFYCCYSLSETENLENATKMGDGAFSCCSSIDSITFGSDFTQLGTDVFSKCTSIESFSVEEDNEFYSSLDGCLYSKNKDVLYAYPLAKTTDSFTIPDSVTTIEKYAIFSDKLPFKSITIPASVTTINSFAIYATYNEPKLNVYYLGTEEQWNRINFYSTSSTIFEVPSKYTLFISGTEYTPDDDTERTCGDNLTWKVENNTLTISGTGAMYDYESEEDTPWYWEAPYKVVIGEGVTYIGECAFSTLGITSITFPDSVKEIGKYAFSNCSGLKNINFNKVEKIGAYAFSSCSEFFGDGLTNVTIGDYVTEIGANAFANCEALSNVKIGKNVSTIGNDAFKFTAISSFEVDSENQNYSAYDDVLFNKDRTVLIKYPENRDTEGYVIPDTVTEVANYAFSYSEYLMSLTIPSSVKKIGYGAFTGSYWFAEVYYYGTQAQWNAINIASGNAELTSATLKLIEPVANVTWTLGNGTLTIKGTGEMTDYTSANPAPWSSFSESITKVVVEEGITYIANRSFISLPNLTEATLPSTVTAIGKYAFFGCKQLTTVNMYGATSSIAAYAFNGCDNLESININGTFDDYKALNIDKNNLPFERANITYTSENGNVYASMSIYARWAYDTATKTLYITNYPHVASRDMLNYRTVDTLPWKAYINEIENVEVNGVLSIGSRSFMGAENLKTATVDDSATRINSWSFFNCKSLETLKLGSSVSVIGTGAFNRADALTSMEFNNTKEKYDAITFGSYNNPIIRTTATLTDGITGYQSGKVFWNIKDGVLTVTGTGAMTSIPAAQDAPWYDYRNEVTKIVIEEGITSIAKYAFNDFKNLNTVEIGEGVTTIGTYAFKNTSVKTVYLPSTITTVGTSSFSSCPKLTNVIYNGTEQGFANVTVGSGNTRFDSATKIYQ